MSGLEDFLERPKDPVDISIKVNIIVRPDALWVGVYRCDVPGRMGGVHLWSQTFDRPEGKTVPQCLLAGLRLAEQAQEAGQVVA